jgi:hypothetical protein
MRSSRKYDKTRRILPGDLVVAFLNFSILQKTRSIGVVLSVDIEDKFATVMWTGPDLRSGFYEIVVNNCNSLVIIENKEQADEFDSHRRQSVLDKAKKDS